VVGQIKDERNFHIFYQLTKGASASQKEALGLQGPSAYAYTAKSKCLDVPGIDDAADWKETIQAMNTIGITAAEQSEILRCLAIILWLGNVTFREDDQGNSVVADASVPEFVAYLMEADVAAVNKSLTSRTMETQRGFGGGGRRGSVYEVPLNPAQAAAARDALAKALYSNLFDWIVERVNQSMRAQNPGSLVIGVLDIYGFEIL
jgi:myosin-1